jgi:thymidine kinase
MTQTFRPVEEDPALRTGSLTVISGSMFSGKTEELIRLSRRALYARRRVQVFKHAEPFGPMPDLLAEADEVVKLRAICARCGRDAARSQRLIDGRPAPASAPTILVGAEESYEARCRHCHEVPEGVFQFGLPGV